ncbi:MAG: PfkB family carbohydrate kinase [Oscillospiraceae bacterium]|nr:PfkB family carbohydrate kinase [Oscillospiraceae bacterium]
MRFYCFGDNNVDIYRNKGLAYPGGNAYNVAAYASMCGARAAYAGNVGADRLGRLQTDSLKAVGVDTSLMRVLSGDTAWSAVQLNDGDREFLEMDISIYRDNPVTAEDMARCTAQKYDLAYASIWAAFTPEGWEAVKALPVPLGFDFSDTWTAEDLERVCPAADYAFLSCSHISEEETKETLKRAVSLGSRMAVGTRGMEGSFLWDGGELLFQPAFYCPAVDTMGAGDSYIARFLVSWLEWEEKLSRQLKSFSVVLPRQEDLNLYRRRALEMSMAEAALFAAATCQRDGAFGFGIPWPQAE